MNILVLGGSRSGKSAFAEDVLAQVGRDVTYVATGVVTDDDMADRVAQHRRRRPSGWTTVEATGADLAPVMAAQRGAVLLDALGTWVASFPDLVPPTEALVAALVGRAAADSSPTVIVTDEVGLGVHPASDVGRRFRDQLGSLNQAVAAVADEVVFVAAGRATRLDPLDRVATDLLSRISRHG